ncbi:MAG: hypothetical protein LBG93_03770 [Treponema sp.]|nr:hypothetical protein [Treponema sp.]
MEKNKYIINKIFPPLDDLFILLQLLEKSLETEINEEDYIIGRKQLYYIFLHETIHAFITKKAKWIHELKDDETDFVDEAAVRIIIDDVIKRLNIYPKMDTYYENNFNHKTDLKLYGFKLKEENYLKLEEEWYKKYSKENDINGLCKYLLEYYRYNLNEIGRDKDFKY